MSDQRKYRAELKQGLHQFLMQMYMSYSESMGQEEAREILSECIEEEYEYFNQSSVNKSSVKEALSAKIQELTDKVNSTKDYDAQMFYAEKVDALEAALEALDYQIS